MGEKTLKATHYGSIKIGEAELPCAVLEDGTRVISERGVTKALGGKRGGAHWRRIKENPDGAYLPVYLSASNIKSCIDDELMAALNAPIVYLPRTGGKAFGLRADLLPQVLEVWLRAADEGKIRPSQQHIVAAAQILIRGLARIGIVALVDEATGYQEKIGCGYIFRLHCCLARAKVCPMNIRNRIQSFLSEYGVRQSHLAREAGIAAPTLSNFLAGKRSDLLLGTAIALEDAMKRMKRRADTKPKGEQDAHGN